MIDFEQLKINNVDLNEKIEERNDDILKLRRKVTSTVQVLTHVKEKLQFLQASHTSHTSHLPTHARTHTQTESVEKRSKLVEMDTIVAKVGLQPSVFHGVLRTYIHTYVHAE